MAKNYCKLRQQQKFITNYCKKLWQITAAVIFVKFKIITNNVKFYYILRQLLVLLQITANFITNCGRNYKLRRYYKLRRNSLNLFFVLCWLGSNCVKNCEKLIKPVIFEMTSWKLLAFHWPKSNPESNSKSCFLAESKLQLSRYQNGKQTLDEDTNMNERHTCIRCIN